MEEDHHFVMVFFLQIVINQNPDNFCLLIKELPELNELFDTEFIDTVDHDVKSLKIFLFDSIPELEDRDINTIGFYAHGRLTSAIDPAITTETIIVELEVRSFRIIGEVLELIHFNAPNYSKLLYIALTVSSIYDIITTKHSRIAHIDRIWC